MDNIERNVQFDKSMLLDNDNTSGDSDSTFEDVDYEDIESVIRSAPSVSSNRSYQYYLDPKSSTNEFLSHLHKDDVIGRISLHAGDMLLADIENAYTTPILSGNNAVETPDNIDENNYLHSYTPYQQTKICTDSIGRVLYIPIMHLKKHGDPTGEPWFYPVPLAPQHATLFLSQQKLDGCFLVYEPCGVMFDSQHCYQLSVCRQNGHVVHYGISEGLHGDYSVVGHDISFMCLSELISYFQSNKSQLVTRLRRPLQHAQVPVTAGIHFASKWDLCRTLLHLNGEIIG